MKPPTSNCHVRLMKYLPIYQEFLWSSLPMIFPSQVPFGSRCQYQSSNDNDMYICNLKKHEKHLDVNKKK